MDIQFRNSKFQVTDPQSYRVFAPGVIAILVGFLVVVWPGLFIFLLSGFFFFAGIVLLLIAWQVRKAPTSTYRVWFFD